MGFGVEFIRFLSAGAIVGALAGQAYGSGCDQQLVQLRGDWGQASFVVEIADDRAERSQGLMNRESMPRSAGMLFVYEQPQPVSFWMENTLIPLDMIFVDPTGLVTQVHENARPLDRTPIPGGDRVLYVLEINGGLAGVLGIAAGSQMRTPLVDRDIAVWPCNAD